ncbi:MAG: DHH family phosphoesterase [Pseudomonadota bacterium]|nr:DHH family phosphoesterase [Pseudomonadota bacterium]
MDYDVFNGDADGICALIQLRLVEPRPDAILVTGVKRDIQLLGRVPDEDVDRVTVLDISYDKNRGDVDRLLAAGADLFFCDHHFYGDVPEAANLDALISPAPEVCTSALVNGRLRSAFTEWAVVGCFGDNLDTTADTLIGNLSSSVDRDALKQLGICVNYNAYGSQPADLHFHPADLYRRMQRHTSPTALLQDDRDLFETLVAAYETDMSAARSAPRAVDDDDIAVVSLPDEAWARRVSGVYGNDLANQSPDKAHAVLTDIDGGYLVSVRAPLNNRTGADTVCRQFETGGGRAAAAGINRLPQDQLGRFIDALRAQYA